MIKEFEKLVCKKYLFSKHKEAFITLISIFSVLGIAIGVTVINITMAIMTGFEDDLRSRIIGEAHIKVYNTEGKTSNFDQVKTKLLNQFKEIKDVSAYTENQIMIDFGNSKQGVLVLGIDPSGTQAKKLSEQIEDGLNIEDLLNTSDSIPNILIEEDLAKQFVIYKGQIISLISSQTGTSPFGIIPKFKRFKVAGFYKSPQANYLLAYTNILSAQKYFRIGDDMVTTIELELDDPDKSLNLLPEVNKFLKTIDQGFIARDWTQLNSGLWEAIKLEKRVYFIVLLLIIVMASFSIVSTLIMIVLEKRKDIAVLKTIGASTKSISNIFLKQGIYIGLVGNILGLALGLAGTFFLKLYGFPLPEGSFLSETLPVKLSPINFIIVFIATFLITLIASLYPAYRASKLKPGDLLRYE